MYYYGENRRRNGIGIIIEESLINNVIKVDRVNDRLMSIKITLGKTIMNIVSSYAPQQVSQEEEKEAYRELIGSTLGVYQTPRQ